MCHGDDLISFSLSGDVINLKDGMDPMDDTERPEETPRHHCHEVLFHAANQLRG